MSSSLPHQCKHMNTSAMSLTVDCLLHFSWHRPQVRERQVRHCPPVREDVAGPLADGNRHHVCYRDRMSYHVLASNTGERRLKQLVVTVDESRQKGLVEAGMLLT